MHFVICMFVAMVCLTSLIIFKEILNKIVSILIAITGCATFSYALAILIKKFGEWFGCWSGDAVYINSNFLWIFPIVLVIYVIVHFILVKREKKQLDHTVVDETVEN